jgi:hypothetical protein
MFLSITILLLSLNSGYTPEVPKFSEVSVSENFKPYLFSNPLLMETAGAKIIRLSNGQSLIISVEFVELGDNFKASILEAKKKCEIKARANILGQTKGYKIYRTETLEEKTEIRLDNSIEQGKSLSTYTNIIKSETSGIIKGMEVIGTWKSKDKLLFYLAIGCCFDKDGNVIELAGNKKNLND